MWSDSYRDYVKQLVLTNRAEYPYYVAHTCTYLGSTSSYDQPNFKVYFSKEPITATSLYNYSLPSGSICYNVIGGNGNNNYHSARMSVVNASSNISINNYEFIYSNAEYSTNSIQPDILATNEVTRADYQGTTAIIITVLLAVILFKLFGGKSI